MIRMMMVVRVVVVVVVIVIKYFFKIDNIPREIHTRDDFLKIFTKHHVVFKNNFVPEFIELLLFIFFIETNVAILSFTSSFNSSLISYLVDIFRPASSIKTPSLIKFNKSCFSSFNSYFLLLTRLFYLRIFVRFY